MINYKPGGNTIVVISIMALVFLFLGASGTLTSGFHFVDDHEVIKMKHELKSLPLIEVSSNWIKTDITSNGRFRPLYYFHRVIETKIFGSDFLLWAVYTAILCCISLISFFLGMRNLKFSIPESVVFLLAIFIGPQSSVWWRLGPQESLGMVFLGLAFYFMSNSFGKSRVNINNLLFIIFLILASLTKESFILIVPGMIFLRIWYEKSSSSISVSEALKRNIILLIPLALAIVELIYIKFAVGTAYAAIGSGAGETIHKLIITSFRFIRSFLHLFILLLFVLPVIFLFNLKNQKKTDVWPVIFFLLVVLPNIILYSGSGMFERYLLPASLGIGFLVASALKEIGNEQQRIKRIATTLAIISFLPFLFGALSDAVEFSKNGRDTNLMLNALAKENHNRSATLLIADPVFSYENSVSLKTYLQYEADIDLFGYCLLNEKDSIESKSYVDGWKYYFDGRQLNNMQSAPESLIFLDKTLVEKFFGISGLLKKDYKQLAIGDSVFALFRKQGNE